MGSSKRNGGGGGCCSSFCIGLWKSIVVVCLVGTNFLALYSLTADLSYDSKSFLLSRASTPLEVTSHLSRVHHELELAQIQLVGIRNDLSAFLGRVSARPGSTAKSKKRAAEVEMLPDDVNNDLNLLESVPSSELQEFIAPHDLPLGKHKLFKISKMASSVGHACSSSKDLLQVFMDYDVGGTCPDDSNIAERLLLRGCEPLPRRRCFARSSESSSIANPRPFPSCLWTFPPDDAVLWTRFSCKNFSCLIANQVNGLELHKERHRWVEARDDHDLLIKGVLALKKGSIRIGLDLDGKSGSVAARMREMNVSIVTTTLDVEAPWSNIVAARGLVPMEVSLLQRLPFFDNTMDIVHSTNLVGAAAMPRESFEFLLYDLDRILRPGGLLWIEKLSSSYELLHKMYIPAIEAMSYDKVRWSVNKHNTDHTYLTALLEKPIRDE